MSSNDAKTPTAPADLRAPRREPKPPQPWSPGAFMGSLSVAATIWLFFGAVGCRSWTEGQNDILTALAAILLFVEIFALSICIGEFAWGWPSKQSAVFTASVVGFGVSATAVLCLANLSHFYLSIFWGNAGVFIGAALEARTSGFQRLHARLAASAASDRARWEAGKREPGSTGLEKSK